MKKFVKLLFVVSLFISLAYSNTTLDENVFKGNYDKALQCIYAISEEGCIVELYDGSIWEVDKNDYDKLFEWSADDEIVIVVNDAFFSGYKYQLYNTILKDKVNINAYHSKSYGNSNMLSIEGVFDDLILLSDGSIWSASNLCFNHHNWLPGDFIVIGFNTSGLVSLNPYILININKNNYTVCSNNQ